MQIIEYEISGVNVFVITMPTHTGYFFKWNGQFYGDHIKVKDKQVDVETMTLLKNMANDTIQQIKNRH